MMEEVHPKQTIVRAKFLKPKGPNRRPKSPRSSPIVGNSPIRGNSPVGGMDAPENGAADTPENGEERSLDVGGSTSPYN